MTASTKSMSVSGPRFADAIDRHHDRRVEPRQCLNRTATIKAMAMRLTSMKTLGVAPIGRWIEQSLPDLSLLLAHARPVRPVPEVRSIAGLRLEVAPPCAPTQPLFWLVNGGRTPLRGPRLPARVAELPTRRDVRGCVQRETRWGSARRQRRHFRWSARATRRLLGRVESARCPSRSTSDRPRGIVRARSHTSVRRSTAENCRKNSHL
jgi:hypothetical protein